MDERIAALDTEVLDWRFKAIPSSAWGSSVADLVASRPALDALGTPLLTLDALALEHNLRTMADWCAAADVDLAPHGKTTMAPALWQRQLAAGATALTLANLAQLRVARAFGVRSIHLANALLDPAGLAWVSEELAHDPSFSFVCWVDSIRAVELMRQALAHTSTDARPVDVCVELGAAGGRTGARTVPDALAVARTVDAAPELRLVGASGYEGALAHDGSATSLATVGRYLRELVTLHDRLREESLLDEADRTGDSVVTAGGSAFFDTVVDELAPVRSAGTRILLRSGAYIAHDDGFYRSISPLSRGSAGTPLRSAIHGWARVVSNPEPDLALLDGGKRDFPFDEGLPGPQLVRGAGPLPATARVTALNDQHTFLRDSGVGVGDVVRLGLSHPCTAFDKWNLVPVVDDADAAVPHVVGLVRTYF